MERRALRALLRLADLVSVGVDAAGEAEAHAEVALRFDLVEVNVEVDSPRRLPGLSAIAPLEFEGITSGES